MNVQNSIEVGVQFKYKLDGKLFRRYTRNASSVKIRECLFADDVAILAATRKGIEEATRKFIQSANNFGLTVNTCKTKLMSTGRESQNEHKIQLDLEDGTIEHVQEFSYLGSTISANGRSDTDVKRRIASASKAFGALRRPVFEDKNLSIGTKRLVYDVCMLSILLYGSEC